VVGVEVVQEDEGTGYEEMDLVTDVYVVSDQDLLETEKEKSARGRVERVLRWIF